MRRIAGVALALGVIVVPPLSARAQQDALVRINNNYFSPTEIRVPVGGTVTWTNDGAKHSATADDESAESFDSSPGCGGPQDLLQMACMTTGDTFEHQFRVAATITYHCRVHGNAMVGTVVVEPASTTTTSSTTSTTSTFATTSTAVTGTSLTSDLPAVSQAPLPSASSNARVVLPKSIIRSDDNDDDDGFRRLVLVAIGMAGTTAVVGIVLVRRGRVPLG